MSSPYLLTSSPPSVQPLYLVSFISPALEMTMPVDPPDQVAAKPGEHAQHCEMLAYLH